MSSSNACATLPVVVELQYGTNPGCVARISAGGSPRQCEGVEAAAVPHRYRYPRPHRARLYVCERHARECPGAEPLNDEDRRVIEERHARRAAMLAPARARGQRPGTWQ